MFHRICGFFGRTFLGIVYGFAETFLADVLLLLGEIEFDVLLEDEEVAELLDELELRFFAFLADADGNFVLLERVHT